LPGNVKPTTWSSLFRAKRHVMQLCGRIDDGTGTVVTLLHVAQLMPATSQIVNGKKKRRATPFLTIFCPLMVNSMVLPPLVGTLVKLETTLEIVTLSPYPAPETCCDSRSAVMRARPTDA
jgi:hypothetical protein